MSEIHNHGPDKGNARSILAELLTPEDLALELGVTDRTIGRWHRRRIGPRRVQIGRKVYYRRESVIAWVASCEHAEPRAHRASGLRVRKTVNSRIAFHGNQ